MTIRFILPVALALIAASAIPQTALAADPTGDPVAGETLFKARCMACHVVGAGQPGVIAPNLRGVVGRKAASTAFNYSPALKASGLTWNKAGLDSFLAAPMKKVPGTRMVIAVSDAKERANVIAWLATLK
jgi:cytochrome c